MRHKNREYNGQDSDFYWHFGWLLVGGFSAVAWLGSNMPEISSNKISINESIFGRGVGVSYKEYRGTDFDGDGVLDKVVAHYGGGRCGMGTHKFKKNDAAYKLMQDKYSRALKSKNK